MLADALAPHGGVVMWRAFVYNADVDADRVKRAYLEFVPLDGKFRDNVFVQVKNGPLDFQPREPFHPLFGALKTPVMTELQITQEYLGQSTHLVYLAPLWREFFDADTFADGPGLDRSSKVVDGSLHRRAPHGHRRRRQHRQRPQLDAAIIWRRPTGMRSAGWRGTPTLAPADIADDWIRMTWGHDPGASCRRCARCCSTPTRPTSTTRCRWACTT